MGNFKHFELSATKVKALIEPGTYTDGDTLGLRITWNEERGKLYKQWVQRISIDGRQRNIGLGGYPKVSLGEARKKAQANVALVEKGQNPIDLKRAARKKSIELAEAPTFWEIAEMVIGKNEEIWTSPKSKQRWIHLLQDYAVPVIGKKRPRAITTDDIEEILKPIWVGKKDTANRLRQQMAAVFDHAIAKKWCEGNPAGLHIIRILPARQKGRDRHMRSMPYQDLPGALNDVSMSAADPLCKLAIQFQALTAGRVVEVRKADWSEFDLDSGVWTIPEHRMKSRKEHRVPLSDRMLEILEHAKIPEQDRDWVFPSLTTSRPYSDGTFSKLFRELGIPSVPHGMRSCFKSWAMEQPDYDRDMSEIALSHSVGNEVEQAYARSDMFEKRRYLMQQWTDFLVTGMERSRMKQTTMALI